ncbi:hypothetical protein BH10PSE19_BH10PSE19_09700 [soil metagenome]
MSTTNPTTQQCAIGERLAQLRKERGITQKDMAKQLDVTQSMVSDYENGVFRIHGDLIIRLAKVLNISADELLGLDKTEGAQYTIQNKRIFKKLRDIDQLPKRDQEALLRTINAFLATAKRAQ